MKDILKRHFQFFNGSLIVLCTVKVESTMRIQKIIIMLFGFYLILLIPNRASILKAENLPPRSVEFEHFTSKEGLVNPVVYDILQDKNGYLWFGTGNGLSKYDGYQFINYLPDKNNPNAIGGGPAIDLYVDQQGRLWIAVINAGLYRYDEKKDGFTTFLHDPNNPKSLSSIKPYSMTEDGQGNLWITTVDNTIRFFTKTIKSDYGLEILNHWYCSIIKVINS